jgi:asparagine N-glycosylation enzyme membrane subunit Stt3
MLRGDRGLWVLLLRRLILIQVCGLAVLCRLGKVARFGVDDLHDPGSPGTALFDYRVAVDLSAGKLPDHAASHPGMAFTAALSHWLFNAAGMRIDCQTVCALLVPAFAAPTCLSMYVLSKEVTGDAGIGLVAAVLLAVLPASTVSGANFSAHGLALLPFLLTLVFYLRALKRERLEDCAMFTAFASVTLVLVAITSRPLAMFLVLLLPFHAALQCAAG